MEPLRVSREPNGVVTVTFNRPEKKNAITYPMWGELTEGTHHLGRMHYINQLPLALSSSLQAALEGR